MKIVLQRVSRASVNINGNEERHIGRGLMLLAGFAPDDGPEDLDWAASKIVSMRIFPDAEGKMNLSVKDIGGEIMLVSQFTLHASVKKGNRPGFSAAAPPDTAVPLYNDFIKTIEQKSGNPPVTGEFGADMKIDMINDGPVTILLDTKNRE